MSIYLMESKTDCDLEAIVCAVIHARSLEVSHCSSYVCCNYVM